MSDNKLISKDKKYQTMDGREVVIYEIHENNGKDTQIHGAIKDPEFGWCIVSWNLDGHYLTNNKDSRDLVEVEEKFNLYQWANIYKDDSGICWAGSFHSFKEVADQVSRNAGNARVACVRVEISGQEGDGLENTDKLKG